MTASPPSRKLTVNTGAWSWFGHTAFLRPAGGRPRRVVAHHAVTCSHYDLLTDDRAIRNDRTEALRDDPSPWGVRMGPERRRQRRIGQLQSRPRAAGFSSFTEQY